MTTQELLRKVRKIEIKTRMLSRDVFAGKYQSAFKGRGMTFAEVREYVYGDDVRFIDWNVTARFGHPYVKVYEEERELSVILLIDVSGSLDFGTVRYKREYIAELAGVLAFSAIENNDKIGVIFFSDEVEKFIPPKKGRVHTLRIIREILGYEPTHRKTNIEVALKFLVNVVKKTAIVFLISDFIAPQFDKLLQISNRKHDVIAIKVNDRREYELPKLGLVQMVDAETGRRIWLDTSDPKVNKALSNWTEKHNRYVINTFTKAGVDYIQLFTGDDYVKPLLQLFKRRRI